MSELRYWKHKPDSQKILKELDLEITNVSEYLVNGGLLDRGESEHLAREYAKQIGYLNGLKFIYSLLDEEQKEEVNDDESL